MNAPIDVSLFARNAKLSKHPRALLAGLHTERHAAWHRLSPDEQAQVKAVAARWQRLDPAQQHAWRERYAALDESERRGWMLGPVLGVDYPRLQPLSDIDVRFAGDSVAGGPF